MPTNVTHTHMQALNAQLDRLGCRGKRASIDLCRDAVFSDRVFVSAPLDGAGSASVPAEDLAELLAYLPDEAPLADGTAGSVWGLLNSLDADGLADTRHRLEELGLSPRTAAASETTITSIEALAALMTINSIALGRSPTDALAYGTLDLMPNCQTLGETENGWRSDAMLRRLYGALSDDHREIVDGDLVGFPTPIWELMTGEMVSL